MRLSDILENVTQFPDEDGMPWMSYIRRVDHGDMDVLPEIAKLPKEAILFIAANTAFTDTKSTMEAIAAIKAHTVDMAYASHRSSELAKHFPKQEPQNKHWDPTADDGPKVVPFRKPAPR